MRFIGDNCLLEWSLHSWWIAGQGYSVVLPEKLQTGKWNVYRLAPHVTDNLHIDIYDMFCYRFCEKANSFTSWQICTLPAETSYQIPRASWNWYIAWCLCVRITLIYLFFKLHRFLYWKYTNLMFDVIYVQACSWKI